MSKPKEYYTIPQIAKQLGLTDEKNSALRYAILSLPITPARKYGKARLFTAEQVAQLKEHFDAKAAKESNNETM